MSSKPHLLGVEGRVRLPIEKIDLAPGGPERVSPPSTCGGTACSRLADGAKATAETQPCPAQRSSRCESLSREVTKRATGHRQVDILEIKIQKLEQLVRLKDSKIATLQARLQQASGGM